MVSVNFLSCRPMVGASPTLEVPPPPLVQPFARLALWLAWWLEHPPPHHRGGRTFNRQSLTNIYRMSTCWLPSTCAHLPHLNAFHLCSSPSHAVWSLHSGTPYSIWARPSRAFRWRQSVMSATERKRDKSNMFLYVLCSSEQPQIHRSDIVTCFRWNAVACSPRTSTPRSIFSTTSLQDTASELQPLHGLLNSDSN